MHECNPVLVKLAELRSRFPPSGTLDLTGHARGSWIRVRVERHAHA